MHLNKRAVVTGASGHLGFHVAQAALQTGLEVELLVRRKNTNIERLLAAGAHFTAVDFDDRSTFRRQLQWADILFQVAGTNAIETRNPALILAGTSGLTEQILNAAVAEGVPRIVYTSSAEVLGSSADPDCLLTEEDRTAVVEGAYVQGKVIAEQLCDRLIRDHGTDLRRLYPSRLLGGDDVRGTPSQRLIRDYLKRGQRFWFPGGVSFASVEEVGSAHVTAGLLDERCGAYILAGENITFREFYAYLAALSGRAEPTVQVPKTLLAAGRSLIGPASIRGLAGAYGWYDSSKAQRELDYRVRPARQVLEAGVLMERKRAAGTNVLFARPLGRQTIHSVSVEVQAPPIAITGAPGWLANRLIDVLMNGDRTGFRHPHRRVHLLVHPRHKQIFDLPNHFQVFPIDLSKPAQVDGALQDVQTVFHLAESVYPSQIETLYRVNTGATRQLVNACTDAGVRRFLYLSSDAVCGSASGESRLFQVDASPKPQSSYGESKRLAEKYILEATQAGLLDGTILRGFWSFGPFAPARQERFLAGLRRERQIVLGNGKNLRSVTHIDNMVAALLAAERSSQSIGKAYWIGDEKPDYTVDEIYKLLCEALGQTYRPIYIPALACSAARLAEVAMKKSGRLNSTVDALRKAALDIAGSIGAAQRDFGYRPVISFAEYARDLAKRGLPAFATKKASAS